MYPVDKMSVLHYDLCIIGGGINGAGIARDAAGRGLSVILVEAEDLAGATSSASSKLIHGGIRYLEHREFSMVRKALKEREILYKNASHLIWPIECVLPHDDAQRPKWLIRLGVWLYDRLAGKTALPSSSMTSLRGNEYGTPLRDDLSDALIYSDCWADDTRLVVLNAVDAAARDAKILTHAKCEKMDVVDGKWRLRIRDTRSDDALDIEASMVVNATGPWVGQFLDSIGVSSQDPDLPQVRLVKGSHIVLPKMYDGDHSYVVQQPDKRIVFISNYEGKYTLVGTTEEAYDGNPRDARISDEEMAYLCHAFSRSFKKEVTRDDVIFAYSGVRPLLDDGADNNSEVTRGYKIYHHKRYDPPFLSVFGGKLTTYRSVSEDVVNKLMRMSGRPVREWTAHDPLTGADFAEDSFDSFVKKQVSQYSWLMYDVVYRYARAYGTRMDYFLNKAQSLQHLGMHFGDDVYQAEIDYLITFEWASNVEDVIWRRSKLGLHITDETIENIDAYIKSKVES